jgi:acyl-CoA thioester hydrolase
MSPAHTVSIRVRYAETDQMGVVYYANFFIWFEIGRVELMRSLGFDYREIEEQAKCFLPVVEATCRYKAPARYDDVVLIRTHLKNVRESLIHFAYQAIREPDGTLLAEGETTHIVTDPELKRRELPGRYLEAFKAAMSRSAPSR